MKHCDTCNDAVEDCYHMDKNSDCPHWRPKDNFNPNAIKESIENTTAPKKLWKLVKEIEESEPDIRIHRHDEAVATMIINFGPDGRHTKGLVSSEMRLSDMFIKVFRHFELDKLRK